MFKLLDQNLIGQSVELARSYIENEVCSQLDVFFMSDLHDSMTDNKYYLQIQDNDSGKTSTYDVVKVLVDVDTLSSGVVRYQLELRAKDATDGKTETFNFNVSEIEPNRDIGSSKNPKYYLYCDNSTEISFRFWFLLKE